jgi:hypothetical protein
MCYFEGLHNVFIINNISFYIRKEMSFFMEDFLSRIGIFSIFLLIIYIMKKLDDYYSFKDEENRSYGFDKIDE